jgi:hypothetical protein
MCRIHIGEVWIHSSISNICCSNIFFNFFVIKTLNLNKIDCKEVKMVLRLVQILTLHHKYRDTFACTIPLENRFQKLDFLIQKFDTSLKRIKKIYNSYFFNNAYLPYSAHV